MTLSSLKILHVGDFFTSLKERSPGLFSVGGKLSNGFIRNGHYVLNFSYRDVARHYGFFNSRLLGRKAMWHALKKTVASFRPDVLILGHGYMIPPEIISEIRQVLPDMKAIQWNIDALFVEQNRLDVVARHEVVDASFVSTGERHLYGLLGDTKIVGFLPNPVDLSVERGRNFESKHLPYDVFYSCGNPDRLREICGRYWQMDEFCVMLEGRLPAETRFAYAGVRQQPYRSGYHYVELLENSAIGLNISRRSDYALYSSDRLAHMIGNGQLVAIERAIGYDRFFSEDEMIFFSSVEELCDRIRYYIRNPEELQKSAYKGWEHYSRLFNEVSVSDYMLRKTFGILKTDEYPWNFFY
ncbi:glycosyltransferase [Acetobacteraceae bacterium ESL0709]|nr:glycosyltransferase [Acetobacteraceae bacterium ESL0697]MDF7678421.1 glycosyltransferase [Acetobacteraceae bacterium ESL0709]